MYISKKHISRRTVLKGMGVTVALPLLDAMVPARHRVREDRAAASARRSSGWSAWRWCTARPAARRFGVKKNLFAPAKTGPRLRVQPDARAARAVQGVRDDHQQHRRAQRRGVHAARNRRRPLPLERGVPDPVASEADRRQRRARRHLARPALRAEVRAGHADSVDAAVDRERRPGRRLHLRLLLHLHRHDQLGVAEAAAADGPRPARRLRSAVRRRRDAGGARRQPAAPTAAFSTGSRPGRRSCAATSAPAIARGSTTISRTSARSSAASSGSRRATPAASSASMPEAPIGVPDSFEEHVHILMDLIALAFASRHDARLLVQARTRRLGPLLPGERRDDRVPQRLAPRRARRPHHRVREDQPLSREHGAVSARQAEEHAGRRRQPARQQPRSSTARRWATRTSTTTSACRSCSPATLGGKLKGGVHIKAADGTPMANAMLTMLHGLGRDRSAEFWRQHRRARSEHAAVVLTDAKG